MGPLGSQRLVIGKVLGQSRSRTEADIDGEAGPVARGMALPGNGDVGADAHGPGQDRSGESEKRGAAGVADRIPTSFSR
jgi:hypothetical protein